ncbi:phenylacetate--CoA ligase family protein [Pseudobythopirellula maris]|nr:phenylacetate--CoA ligase family protein [Pseudobythopirellula maris]
MPHKYSDEIDFTSPCPTTSAARVTENSPLDASPPTLPERLENVANGLWQSVRFGARALELKADTTAPRERIEQKQRRRLRRLLAHAKEHSPYLAQKYADHDPETARLEDLPTVSKGEVMEHFDEYLTVDLKRDEVEAFMDDEGNLGKLCRDEFVLSHTSGSTGQPLLLVKSRRDFELLFALQASRGNSEELDLSQMLSRLVEPVRLAAVTMQPGFYPSGTAFQYMPEGVRNFIDVKQLSFSDCNFAEQLAEFRPTHLSTYASILHDLARREEAGEINLKDNLRQITNISEVLLPDMRRRYGELFGATMLDDYGMGECLFLTNGCPKTGGMHVNADWAIVETVDEENRPVPVGERCAKVLVTNLANRVQPFIRYEVSDILVMAPDESCGCGSRLPLIERVEGRTSDLLFARQGDGFRSFHPGLIEKAIGSGAPVREYRLTQDELGKVRIEVEPIGGNKPDTAEVERAVRESLETGGVGDGLDVTVEVVERLAPEDGGKFKRVVLNVEPPSED